MEILFCCPAPVAIGTSRHFGALQNLISIGVTADIEQALPGKLEL